MFLFQNYRKAIMDDLWFIHTANGALFQLFGTNPDPASLFLSRWEGWHIIASKFLAPSPIFKAYYDPDEFIAFTLKYFFEYNKTHRYLFTLQMRHLLYKMNKLSQEHNLNFHNLWHKALTFNQDTFIQSQEAKPMARTLLYQGKLIQVEPVIKESQIVDITDEGRKAKRSVHYTLHTWKPKDGDAQRAFTDITNQPNSHELFFAIDFEKDVKFHVNEWEEVIKYLKNEYD